MPAIEYTPEDLACEEWRPIIGYEGIYDISTIGRFRRDGRILTPNLVGAPGKQYYRAQLWRNNKASPQYIHRLVATAFVDNPEDLPKVDHKDRDKLNNRHTNLRWCLSANNSGNQQAQRSSTSRFRGVFFDVVRQAWIACVSIDRKFKVLGAFRTAEAAAIAYDQYARVYWGEFAFDNTKVFGLACSAEEEQQIMGRDRIVRVYGKPLGLPLTAADAVIIRGVYAENPTKQTVADLATRYQRSGQAIVDIVKGRTFRE